MHVLDCSENKIKVELTEEEIRIISGILRMAEINYTALHSLSIDFQSLIQLMQEFKQQD